MSERKLSLILGAKDRLSSVLVGASKKSDKAFEKLTKRIKNVSKGFENVGKSSITAGRNILAGVTIGVTALSTWSGVVAAAGDRIDKMSQKIGMSRVSFQEYDYILSQNGGNIQNLEMGYKTLANQIAAARKGTKDSVATFNKLHVSIKTSNGQLKSQEQIFKQSVRAIQNIKNPTEKAILANKLFGRSALSLKPLLNKSADSIEKLRQNAHAYGMIKNDRQIDACVKLTDTIDTLKRSFAGMGMTLGMEVVPHIQALSDKILANMPRIRKEILPVLSKSINLLVDFIQKYGVLTASIGGGLVVFGGLSLAVSKTLNFIVGFGTAYRNVAKFMQTYRFVSEIKSLNMLGNSFRDLIRFSPLTTRGLSVIGTQISGLSAKILPFNRLVQMLGTSVGGQFSSAILTAGGTILKFGGMIANAGAALGLNPITLIIAGVALAGLLIVKYWKPITSLFKGIGDGIKTALAPAFKSLSPVLAPVFNWFKKLFKPINTTGKASYNAGVAIGKFIGKAIKFGATLFMIFTPIGRLIGLTLLIAKNFDKIKAAISGAGNSLKNFFSKFGGKTVSASVNVKNSNNAKINGSHANGLANVPFDGYIAELHKGERVLTANENRQLRNYNNSGIRIVFAPTINADANTDVKSIEQIVRQECNKLIAQLNSRTQRMQVGSYYA